MPAHARLGTTWRSALPWVRHGTTWKLPKTLWAKSGATWLPVASSITGASASGGSGYCTYPSPGGSCLSVGGATAFPLGGYAPYTYLWERTGGWDGATLGNMTSKSMSASANTQFTRYVDVRCRVTDATGTQVWTPSVTITLAAEREGV